MAKGSLPRIKDVAYMINPNNIVFRYLLTEIFDYFGIEYIHQELLNKIKDKSITRNVSKF